MDLPSGACTHRFVVPLYHATQRQQSSEDKILARRTDGGTTRKIYHRFACRHSRKYNPGTSNGHGDRTFRLFSMPSAISLRGVAAKREKPVCGHGYFMHLSMNHRWTDTNMESPHRLGVPMGGMESLVALANCSSPE